MKKIVAILTMLILASNAFAQAPPVSSNNVMYIANGTFDLTGSTETTLYIVFHPPEGAGGIRSISVSTTLPSFNDNITPYGNLREFESWGDVGISVIADSITADKWDPDSVYSFIKPLFPDHSKEAWKVSTNDSTFINFTDIFPQCVSTLADGYSAALTHGEGYTASLSNETWPFRGIAWTVGHVSDVASADMRFYYTITY